MLESRCTPPASHLATHLPSCCCPALRTDWAVLQRYTAVHNEPCTLAAIHMKIQLRLFEGVLQGLHGLAHGGQLASRDGQAVGHPFELQQPALAAISLYAVLELAQ